MSRKYNATRKGFSLIELVIVVVIIGIIAAIAIPRMSRGTSGAGDSALSGNLNVLRNAIELYQTEHNGKLPTAAIEDELTKYTSEDGTTNATKTNVFAFGPYLRTIPPITVGSLKVEPTKNNKIQTAANDTPVAAASATGAWLYNTATGNIRPNLVDAEVDQNGKAYNSY